MGARRVRAVRVRGALKLLVTGHASRVFERADCQSICVLRMHHRAARRVASRAPQRATRCPWACSVLLHALRARCVRLCTLGGGRRGLRHRRGRRRHQSAEVSRISDGARMPSTSTPAPDRTAAQGPSCRLQALARRCGVRLLRRPQRACAPPRALVVGGRAGALRRRMQRIRARRGPCSMLRMHGIHTPGAATRRAAGRERGEDLALSAAHATSRTR